MGKDWQVFYFEHPQPMLLEQPLNGVEKDVDERLLTIDPNGPAQGKRGNPYRRQAKHQTNCRYYAAHLVPPVRSICSLPSNAAGVHIYLYSCTHY